MKNLFVVLFFATVAWAQDTTLTKVPAIAGAMLFGAKIASDYLKHRRILRRNAEHDRNIAEGEARAAKLAAEVADRWRD
jgi:hypothetical protein